MNRTIQAFIVVFALATVATATDGPSIEHGKKLFNSSRLGTNERSCSTCHSDGKGLEDAMSYDEKVLANITNQCIVKALKGKALDEGSVDLNSLVMYQKTIGAAKMK